MGDVVPKASKVILYGSNGFLGECISRELQNWHIVTFDRSKREYSERIEKNSIAG